jgi:uncharacterized repeat protein (TIGR01451 family)
MTNKMTKFAGPSALVIALLGVTPAMAAGTTAGSTITNTATVNYQVGTVSQTAINASNSITVDRRVTLTVVQLGTSTTSVSPGQTQAATTFTITNTSNAPLDLGLTAANLATSTAAPNGGGNDAFDVGAFTYYVDNGDNVFGAGDTLVTYLDEIAADASRVVHVIASVPLTATNGQIAAISLTAQAKEAGTAGTEGAVVTATAGANTAGMDTVLADTAGSDDAATDGRHSARDDYTVAAPVLTVTKISRVISDPINGISANAKMIPGAVVEYCITVANASGAATAANVVITDPLPAQTTYVSAFGVFEGGTVASAVCSGGTATGTFASPTVTGNLGTVAAGTTETVYFRITIN